MQLTIFDIEINSGLSDRIKEIIKCDDRVLINAIARSIENFINLPKQQYILSFSGGKDSHVLLAIYVLYLRLGYPPLDIVIRFADTKLEYHSLYSVIKKTEAFCRSLNLPFEVVQGKQSYWVVQFVLGYPVPDFRNRWCTGKLKVMPMQPSKKIKSLTGRHLGESTKRNKSLNATCGGDSCGTDLIKDKYDPLIHWRNCQIWDAIFYFDGVLLYENVFNILQEQYKIAEDTKTGSLRLGCFMCPVISIKTIENNKASGLIEDKAVSIRLLLEELRNARRILSPRTKKNGAIYIGDRRKYWKLLDKDYLTQNQWIEESDIALIDKSLESNYSYPPTYTKEWIDEQHQALRQDN